MTGFHGFSFLLCCCCCCCFFFFSTAFTNELESSLEMARTAGYGDEKLSSVLVTGTLLCEACLDGEAQSRAWHVPGFFSTLFYPSLLFLKKKKTIRKEQNHHHPLIINSPVMSKTIIWEEFMEKSCKLLQPNRNLKIMSFLMYFKESDLAARAVPIYFQVESSHEIFSPAVHVSVFKTHMKSWALPPKPIRKF